MNTIFNKLPFKKFAEKIPDDLREKIPFINILIPFTNHIVCVLALLVIIFIIAGAAGGETAISVPSSLKGQAFISLPLAMVTTGYNEPNLNALSSRNNQFNVFIEEGMEPLWKRVKSLYGIKARSDWIVIMPEEDIIQSVGVVVDNGFSVLYITSKSGLMNALVIGSSGTLALCLDPKNALNN